MFVVSYKAEDESSVSNDKGKKRQVTEEGCI